MATIIIADKAGRLGNRIILFAHLIAFAKEHGLTIFNPAFEEYSDFFAGTAGRAMSRYPRETCCISRRPQPQFLFRSINLTGRMLRRLSLDNGLWSVRSAGYVEETDGDIDLDNEYHRKMLLRSQVTFLFGFRFRCYELLAKHDSVIREYFAPSDGVASVVDAAISRLGEDVDHLVAVHIRQGDYRDFLGGRMLFDLEHYAMIMRRFCDLLPRKKIRFVICSDESVDLSRFGGIDVALGPGDIASDFFVLSRCDYLIATKSTFSRWASFLGQVPLLTIDGSPVELKDVRDLQPAQY